MAHFSRLLKPELWARVRRRTLSGERRPNPLNLEEASLLRPLSGKLAQFSRLLKPLVPLGYNFSQHSPTAHPSVERTAGKAFLFCFRKRGARVCRRTLIGERRPAMAPTSKEIWGLKTGTFPALHRLTFYQSVDSCRFCVVLVLPLRL